MKVTGWSYEEKPHHKNFCNTCEYLFTVRHHFEDGTYKYSDVYKNCSGGWSGDTAYIINNSDRPGDYHSGVELKNLMAIYVTFRHGWK